LLIFALVAFVSTFGMNPQITTALMTKNVFHAGAGSFGLASTVFAVGSLVGALLAARAGRLTKRTTLGAALLFGALEAVSALAPTYVFFLVLLVLTGLMMVVFNTSVVAILQLDVTPEMRGRISGLFVLIFNGTTPIGAPVIGWLAQTFGARAALAAAGVVSVLAAVAVAPLLVRRGLAAEGRVRDLVEKGRGDADVSIG
jgi:MFS family permease